MNSHEHYGIENAIDHQDNGIGIMTIDEPTEIEPESRDDAKSTQISAIISEYLTHDFNTGYSVDGGRLEEIEATLTALPAEIVSAIYGYVIERDVSLWREATQSIANQALVIASEQRRNKYHNQAATLLTENDPQRFPDITTARDFIADLLDDLVSQDIAEEHRWRN
jgi:hypothetical protein